MEHGAAQETMGAADASAHRRTARRGVPLAAWARLFPSRPAVRSPFGDRTFLELEANSNRLAHALFDRDVRAGDSLALVCRNRPEFVEVMLAAERAGIRITPVMHDLTPREAAYIIADCEASAVVIDAGLDAHLVALVLRLEGLKAKIAIGADLPGSERYDAMLAAAAAAPFNGGGVGIPMFYTSGTTGPSKGVYRHELLPRSLTTVIGEALKLESGRDVALAPVLLCRSGVFMLSVRLPLACGVGVVLVDERDPEPVLSLIAWHRITYAYLTPLLFHRLLQLPEAAREGHDLSSLRHILHGGAPCPVVVKRGLIEWLGPIVTEYYAGTEGGDIAIASEDWLKKPGSVGKADDRVAILDDDGGPVSRGKIGHIYLRAPPRGRFEYFKAPEKTRAAYRGDFYTMGDQGYLDEDGFLFLTGRSAEIIINASGLNIYPAEVDGVLLDHPAVDDAACVGVPNEEMGEEVKAVIKLKPGHAASADLIAELALHCRTYLAAYKCPRSFDFVDELPRLATGKLLRQELRRAYWRESDREI